MSIEVAVALVTAISTAVTAIVAVAIAKQNSAPALLAHVTEQGRDQPVRLQIVIYPGDRGFHIHRISAKNALIDTGNWNVTGRGIQVLEASSHGLTRRSIPADIHVPSSRFPGNVDPVYLLVVYKNSRRAARISLHTRFMLLPIKYSVSVKPDRDAA